MDTADEDICEEIVVSMAGPDNDKMATETGLHRKPRKRPVLHHGKRNSLSKDHLSNGFACFTN